MAWKCLSPPPQAAVGFWIADSLFSLPIHGESKEKNLSLPSAQVRAVKF